MKFNTHKQNRYNKVILWLCAGRGVPLQRLLYRTKLWIIGLGGKS